MRVIPIVHCTCTEISLYQTEQVEVSERLLLVAGDGGGVLVVAAVVEGDALLAAALRHDWFLQSTEVGEGVSPFCFNSWPFLG